MSKNGTADGVVIDWPDLHRFDTRAMRWEEFPAIAGTKVKVLTRDDAGHPSTFIQWLPPGELEGVALPHRHFHRTVTEYAYVLSGDLPHWEYGSAEEEHGQLVVFREGYFMERRPGSIHGLEPGPVSETGVTILFWRDGTGTMVDEPDFAQETEELSFSAGWQPPATPPEPLAPQAGGVVLERPDVRILDTREMEWEDWGGETGMKARILSRLPDGNPATMLVWLPPGELQGIDLPARHYHRTVTERSFMLAGELPHWEYRSADDKVGELVIVRPGYFMERLPGSVHGLEPGPTSQTGALYLFRQTGSGNWVDSAGHDEETFDVPY